MMKMESGCIFTDSITRKDLIQSYLWKQYNHPILDQIVHWSVGIFSSWKMENG